MEDNNSPWQYKPDNGSTDNSSSASEEAGSAPHKRAPQPVEWEAVEFIEHQRGSGWYAGLFIITIGLAAAAYFLAKDIISVVIIAMVGAIIFVFVNQKPGRAKYEINHSGLSVNGKLYNYSSYKSFAIIKEGDMQSVYLFPLKRFLPPLSAYFEPQDEKKIMNALGNYLPYEDRPIDVIDRLTRRLRL